MATMTSVQRLLLKQWQLASAARWSDGLINNPHHFAVSHYIWINYYCWW